MPYRLFQGNLNPKDLKRHKIATQSFFLNFLIFDTNQGRQTEIYHNDEQKLDMYKTLYLRFAEWVVNMARYGFPRTPIQIKEAVKLYLDKSGINVSQFKDNRPGKTWFFGFLRCHPEIKLGRAETLEQSPAMACTKESVYAWFDQFEAFLSEHGIISADQIYNCDESAFPLQTGTSMKVCCDRQIRRNFK